MTHSISSRPLTRAVAVAAAVLAMVLALSGCGPGTADEALKVGNTTYSADHVDALLTAYLHETGQSAREDPASLTQARQGLINNLAVNELTSTAAARLGVTVSHGQVSAGVTQQLAAADFADIAKQYVIPRSLLPDMIRASFERIAIGDKLAGVTSNTQANAQKSQAAMSTYLLALGGSEHVWVNPRYGVWTPSKLAVSAGGGLVQSSTQAPAAAGS